MLIVLEGCDGSGKSTLASSLAKILDAEVVHCTQFTPNTYKFFNDIVNASQHRNIIADRFCYGQFVYQEEDQRPLKDFTGNSLETLHRLEMRMLETGAKVIHVTAPDETIKDRLALRGEVVINRLSVEDVQARYRGTFRNSMLNIIEWNTGMED